MGFFIFLVLFYFFKIMGGKVKEIIFAISTIVSYILSQIVPEIFIGVMNFSLFGVLFGGGIVAISHILSIKKPGVVV